MRMCQRAWETSAEEAHLRRAQGSSVDLLSAVRMVLRATSDGTDKSTQNTRDKTHTGREGS